ncbi:hypothetical protein PMV48_13655, partial [Enterococcus avium]|uniref:hypothetical protein n=1 Tax=Enterococcus avium TaxID=33945 RepID=UPI00232F2EE0
ATIRFVISGKNGNYYKIETFPSHLERRYFKLSYMRLLLLLQLNSYERKLNKGAIYEQLHVTD